MSASKSFSYIKHHLLIAFLVLIACVGLGWLDHETHSASDFLKPGNLIALLIYFTPAFVASVVFFHLFRKKRNNSVSIALSIVTGVPLGFILVVVAFTFAMRG